MVSIVKLQGRQILDSRGNPTVEGEALLSDGAHARAAVPSGASTGLHEAIELRDCDNNRYNGKGVRKAIGNILNIIKPEVINKEFINFEDFDNAIIAIDGTNNKSNIGANSTLGLSLAFTKALAA